MQTKLKPLFFLVTTAATAIFLHAATDVQAQKPSIGIFDVSAFSPKILSINPKLKQPEKLMTVDSMQQVLPNGPQIEIHSDY